MNFTLGDLLSWLIVGALAGWLAGIILRRENVGWGLAKNLAIGLAGEFIGVNLFYFLKVSIGLFGAITISFQDIVAALIGTLAILGILWFAGKRFSWLRRI